MAFRLLGLTMDIMELVALLSSIMMMLLRITFGGGISKAS